MEYIQWHPAFVASLKVGCSKERMKVEVESEHNLSKKPMQIIVTSELSEKKNFWLKYLTDDLKSKEVAERIVNEYKNHQTDELYKAMMNVIVNANRDIFEEVKYMCEALRELFKEDMERELAKGRAEGRARGIEEGRAEGRAEALQTTIKNLMNNLAITWEQALDAMGVSAEERKLLV